MHCLVYNLKRVLSILGTKEMIAAIRRKATGFSFDFAAILLKIQFSGHLAY